MDLAQAYFLLKSLKENTPDTFEVEQKWVDDFHTILDTVGKETGEDLLAFRVEANDLHHPVVGGTRAYARHGRIVPGQVRYGSKTVVERARLMHKVDAVLSYFQFKQGASDAPKRVGFAKEH
jgi:hypothetical protein